MQLINTLEAFGKKVVKESRQNLTKKQKNASKELYNSIKYNIENKNGSTVLSFEMADYGEYIDKGVKGSKDQTRAPKSPYKYTNKMPPTKSLDRWVVKRGLAGRNKKGQFVSRESIKFAIARSIFLKGIETTNFFTRPLEQNFNKLADELLNSFGNDIVL